MLWGAAGGAVSVAGLFSPDYAGHRLLSLVFLLVLGLVLVYVVLQGVAGVADLDRRLTLRFLAPSAEELLQRRVSQLSTSRAEVVAAINDERRRIERDLHDGVQQRLVALGVLIGRASRSQSVAKTEDLLRQAREESQQALNDLRDVAWRVYPTELDHGGLRPALESLAQRSTVPVQLRYELTSRPDKQVEAVAYFVVSEAVTNVAKHSGSARVHVHLGPREDNPRMIVVSVHDNGTGGADPAGEGLSGLARRVGALDGRFRVDSPAGGPTTVMAELPCE